MSRDLHTLLLFLAIIIGLCAVWFVLIDLPELREIWEQNEQTRREMGRSR